MFILSAFFLLAPSIVESRSWLYGAVRISVSAAEIRSPMVSGTDACCVAVGLGVGVRMRPSHQHQLDHHQSCIILLGISSSAIKIPFSRFMGPSKSVEGSISGNKSVECWPGLEDIHTCSRCIVLSGLIIVTLSTLTCAGIVSLTKFA